MRTPALSMPDALAGSGPGLYALTARAGDGTPNASTGVQMIVRTDFAPTIWRGTDGLTVQVRSYSDVHPAAPPAGPKPRPMPMASAAAPRR